MNKRYLPVAIVTVLLLAVGVGGYLAPSKDGGAPVRVYLENPGGPVFFTHQQHAEAYGVECGRCHHQSQAFDNPPACQTCHPKAFDQTWAASHQDAFQDRAYCRSCHHARYDRLIFDHEAHEDYGECSDCHHGPDIEPEPARCSDCHEQQADGAMPGLMNAAHTRCESCHEDFYDVSPKNAGCKNCHQAEAAESPDKPYVKCSFCHEKPVKDLVPVTGDAFHRQCMGCHEEQGAGPYGADSCKQCHR